MRPREDLVHGFGGWDRVDRITALVDGYPGRRVGPVASGSRVGRARGGAGTVGERDLGDQGRVGSGWVTSCRRVSGSRGVSGIRRVSGSRGVSGSCRVALSGGRGKGRRHTRSIPSSFVAAGTRGRVAGTRRGEGRGHAGGVPCGGLITSRAHGGITLCPGVAGRG
jgi:hypothetical protein